MVDNLTLNSLKIAKEAASIFMKIFNNRINSIV